MKRIRIVLSAMTTVVILSSLPLMVAASSENSPESSHNSSHQFVNPNHNHPTSPMEVENYLYTKSGVLRDPLTGIEFLITLRSHGEEIINLIDPSEFEISVTEVEDEFTNNEDPVSAQIQSAPPDNIPVDKHSFVQIDIYPFLPDSLINQQLKFSILPPYFLNTSNPSSFGDGCASICFVYGFSFGEVKSVVVRRGACGGGSATFNHSHCWYCQSHFLSYGQFSSCTYAYDCIPGHTINRVLVCGLTDQFGWPLEVYYNFCGGRC